MPHTSHQATKPADATSLLDLVRDGGGVLFALIQKRRQAARDRNTLAALSDAQLADVGIDRWSIDTPHPSVEVKAGLMAKLMSMR